MKRGMSYQVIVIILCIVTNHGVLAQDSAQESFEEQILVIPLTSISTSNATLTSFWGRKLFVNLEKINIPNTHVDYVVGNPQNLSDARSLIEHYLLGKQYTMAIFVWLESIASPDTEYLYTAHVEIFNKVSRRVYKDSVEIDLTNIVTSPKKLGELVDYADNSTEIEEQQLFSNIADVLHTFIDRVEFSTVLINPDSEERPEYKIVTDGVEVISSSPKYGEFYLEPGEYFVEIYQLYEDKEVLVGSFSTELNKRHYVIEVDFYEEEYQEIEQKPLIRNPYILNPLNIILSGGVQFPIYYIPNLLTNLGGIMNTRILYSFKKKGVPLFVGGDVLLGGMAHQSEAEGDIFEFGAYAIGGGIFSFADSFEVLVGLGIGPLFLLQTSITNDAMQFESLSTLPSIKLSTELAYNFPETSIGLLKLALGFEFLMLWQQVYTANELDLTAGSRGQLTTVLNILGNATLGVGMRF